MVKTKYVNRVYKKFKDIVNSLAMWDNKKFMYVSVDYVIYKMCDIPNDINREDVLKEVIPKLNKKKIRLDSSADNEIYSLSWYEMSTTKIKLKLYFNQYFDLEHILSYSLISFIVIMVLYTIFILALVAIKYGIVQLLLVLFGVLGAFVALILIGTIIGMICAVDLGYKRYKQKHNKGRD